VMIDELYGELDEITSAAVKDHLAGCERCSNLLRGLRATRRLSALPTVPPPVSLEQRILRRVNSLPKARPTRRLGRAVSAAGSWAMRPQTAMVAVFLVMIGTSVLLLRERSSRAPASAEVTVTEQGAPAPAAAASVTVANRDDLAVLPSATFQPEAPSVTELRSPTPAKEASNGPSGLATSDLAGSSIADRSNALRKGDGLADRADTVVAKVDTEAAKPQSGAGASAPMAPAAASPMPPSDPGAQAGRAEGASSTTTASSALAAARAIRQTQGCSAAVGRFDDVAVHLDVDPEAGAAALLDSARCYESLGDVPRARARLGALLRIPAFRERAQSELSSLDHPADSAAP